MSWPRTLLAILAVGSLLLTAVAPAVAAASLDVTTSYDGAAGEDQSVDVELSLSPQGSAMTDVTIDISETNRAFVDYDSFSTTVTPGSANVNVSYEGDGRFTVQELAPSETVTITFSAYPRTIQQESLPVSSVRVSYVQNGQDLTDRQQVTADLSDSPWFELQSARERVDQFRLLGYGGGAVIGLLVLGGVGFAIKKVFFGGGDFDDSGGGGGGF